MSLLIHRHKVQNNAGAVEKTAPASKPVAKKVSEPVAEETKVEAEENAEGFAYTKTEINRSSTERLKEIATEVGIEDADDKTGGELKKLIIGQLGL